MLLIILSFANRDLVSSFAAMILFLDLQRHMIRGFGSSNSIFPKRVYILFIYNKNGKNYYRVVNNHIIKQINFQYSDLI